MNLKQYAEVPHSRGSTAQGLTSERAAEVLARHGPNILPAARGPSPLVRLWHQLFNFFAVMLWIAGLLAFVARLPELGIAIFVVIAINGVFAFAQEHRAERAAEKLRELLPLRVKVLRDGEHQEIDASEVVVGDLILLADGDRIPADIRLREGRALMIDTSTLTGESVPCPAEDGETLFAGTFVTEGEGAGEVTATGLETRLATIATLTRAITRPRSPLTIELHRVVRTIAAIAIGVGVVFFGTSLLLGTKPTQGFVFAIGVTVALVPEGLLPTVTLSLALGAQRLAARHALVRRLEAVETLGSTTFICTDKTGTLTLNQMSVVEVWTQQGRARSTEPGYQLEGEVDVEVGARPAISALALTAARCSRGRVISKDGNWIAQGDPMEAALYAFACRLGLDVDENASDRPEMIRFPFDPRRRRMSVVAGDDILVKGAPDSVLPLCLDRTDAAVALREMTDRGLRVLAVARRRCDGAVPSGVEEAEHDLVLLGLLGLEDPPRDHAQAAISACRRAGIKIAMVTGDHPRTAAAIAREVGLTIGVERVVTGADLPLDEGRLGELLDHDGIVIARVQPEDKLRIARALRARGHVVAMTGDGVNDAPALQEADIGIAMGRSGTDVAREAADLVLLDDDFATIVAAIEEGRSTFSNVKRFLTYHLTDNVAELTPFLVWALSGGRFPLALGVLQILALDIGTDTLPAVALGAEPPSQYALEQEPIRGRLLDATVARRAFVILGPTEALFGMAAFLAALAASGWRLGETFPTGHALTAASGATFATVVIGQMANAFACRSTTRTPRALGWLSNRLLVGAVLIEIAVTAVFLVVGPVARVLGHSPPPLLGWAVAGAAAISILVADAAFKRRRGNPPKQGR